MLSDTILDGKLVKGQEKIHISFFEACFVIACVCIYVAYMNKLVFKTKGLG